MMSSENRLKHIIQKYPHFLVSLTTNLTKKHAKYPGNRLDRVVRRSLERSSRYRPTRRPSTRLLRLVVSEALTCPVCLRVLHAPVTLECGDTFCRGCLPEETPTECPKCGRIATVEPTSCNVLVQELVNRLTGSLQQDCQSLSCNHVLHEYKLRNRVDDNKSKNKEVKTVEFETNDQSSQHLTSNNVLVRASDVECILCARCLYEPVTTACGHTFCRGCVARVLDYNLPCPLCRAPCAEASICHALDAAIRRLLPRPHAERARAHQREILSEDGDHHVPVMVCTSAFPGVACPLYISEPRYRLLTRRCLQTSRRRFAMAAPGENGERFASFGTVLEVRDALHLSDGTSILTTIGLKRFRVLSKDEKDGYDTATIEYIHDEAVPENALEALYTLHDKVYNKTVRWIRSLPNILHDQLERSLGAMPALEPAWASLNDGPAWAWWLVPVLPLSPALQLGFLSTLVLEKRLRAIDKLLDRMSVRMRARGHVARVPDVSPSPAVDSCTSSSMSGTTQTNPMDC